MSLFNMLGKQTKTIIHWSFNPCFNGCLSSTVIDYTWGKNGNVSILVLMDVSLQLIYADNFINRRPIVSILVLMDVSLQPEGFITGLKRYAGFNPCFNGCLSSTLILWNFGEEI